jgi:hypothetical protein
MMKLIKPALIAAIAVSALPAIAQVPVQNVDPARHPELAAAQSLSRQAFDRLTAAQRANGYDLGGHASQAKALLLQANDEIKLAAISANRRRW